MKTARNSLLSFLDLDISRVNIQLCFACSDGDGVPEFEHVNIAKPVASQFREMVCDWQSKYIGLADGDISLQKYDPQTKLDAHELEVLSLEAHPEISNQIKDLFELTEMSEFDADNDFIDRLRFYALVLKPKGLHPALLFRFYTKAKELSRSTKFGIFLKDGQYDKLTETTFLFDGRFDCLVHDSYAFVINKDGFHKIFRFYEMLMRTANKTLDIIEKQIPIANFDDFRSACTGHLQKVAKLKNISTKPYFSKIKIADLKKVIAKFELPITTVGSGVSEKLQFDAGDKWAILKLLDDDYLESIMTGEKYEVNSKRQLAE